MTTSLARKSASLAERMNMAPAQLELIRRMCIRDDAPDDVLELYLHRCKSIGVDPFDKMIYVIPRSQNVKDERTGAWRKEIRWTFQSSIDLFRSIAEQSEDYAGQLGPFWTADGITWLDVWISEEPPLACRVGVLRHSFKQPMFVTGTYAYYVPRNRDGNPEPTAFWKGEKGAHQLAKCVEELALRKAFPRKLQGIYGTDEMAQAPKAAKSLPEPLARAEQPPEDEPQEATFTALPAPPEPEEAPRAPQPNLIDRRKKLLGDVHALLKERGIARAEYLCELEAVFPEKFREPAWPQGKEPSSAVLAEEDLQKLIEHLSAIPSKATA